MSKMPKLGSGDARTGKTPSGATGGKSGIELVPVNLTVNGAGRAITVEPRVMRCAKSWR